MAGDCNDKCGGYIRYPCYTRIIPLVYDDSLSYYENLCAIICKLNELLERVDVLEGNLDEILKDKVLKMIQDEIQKYSVELHAELDAFKVELRTYVEALSAELKESQYEYERKTDEKINSFIETTNNRYATIIERIVNIDNAILELWNMYERIKDEYKTYIDMRFNQMFKELKDMIAFVTGDKILVNNPVKLKITNLNTALADILEYGLAGGITADEYRSLNLTAQEYADLNITAFEYAFRARWIFFDRLYLKPFKEELDKFISEMNSKLERQRNEYLKLIKESQTMTSPFTGVREDYRRVIYSLSELHKEYLTAQEYADLNLTAEEYEEKEVSAYDYDWNGRIVFGLAPIHSAGDGSAGDGSGGGSLKTEVDFIKGETARHTQEILSMQSVQYEDGLRIDQLEIKAEDLETRVDDVEGRVMILENP